MLFTRTLMRLSLATGLIATCPGALVINEIHADPDSTAGDANGDGNVDSSDDEFVEIVNHGAAAVDLSGWSLSDLISARHEFPIGTLLASGRALVVFGGGTPTGPFGGSVVQGASSGALLLNNSGDTVTLRDEFDVEVVALTYGSQAGDNQSLTRDPDITGPEPLVRHSTASGSGGALYSPGTKVDGNAFEFVPDPEIAVVPTLPYFGDRQLGAGPSPPLSVVITNEGTTPLSFVGAEIAVTGAASSDYAADATPPNPSLDPGASRTVQVVFTPTTFGNRNAALSITSDDADEPTVAVTLLGTGLAPEIAVAPDTLAFGEWPVNAGPSLALIVAVANVGNVDLEFTPPGVVLSSTASPEFVLAAPPDTSPLSPGSLRTFDVAFDPSSLGGKAADLVITTGDADEPTVIISLTGMGTEFIGPTGLTTAQIVETILGRADPVPARHRLDLNEDDDVDAADVVVNENALPE
jgi:hypothetical protein